MFILTDSTDVYVLEIISSRIWEYFGSNDFMITEPHDVPPTFCFIVQTDMRFLLQQLQQTFYNAFPLKRPGKEHYMRHTFWSCL